MPTPEVTGSAASHSEEIKKIASEYGESEANCFDYDMYSNPDFRHKLKAKSEANKAKAVLEWLSKDYCIVPKSKVMDYYNSQQRQLNALCNDPRDAYEQKDARSQILAITNLFDSELFEVPQ